VQTGRQWCDEYSSNALTFGVHAEGFIYLRLARIPGRKKESGAWMRVLTGGSMVPDAA